VLVILTLVVTVLVLLLLIIALALWFWHRRKQIKKPPIYLEVSKLTLSLSAQSQIPGGKGEVQQIKESPKIT
jgi:HAMP domain-containing protein